MPNVNYLAVIVAGAAGMVLGLIWYSRFALSRIEHDRTDGSTDSSSSKSDTSAAAAVRHPWRRRIVMLPIDLIVNIAAAVLLAVAFDPLPSPFIGAGFGALIGSIWVGGSLGIHAASGRTAMSMWLSDLVFHTSRFALIALILCMWR